MTIYHLVNDEDYGEVCLSSTDKGLLEEIMCDSFMNDVLNEFNIQMAFSCGEDRQKNAQNAWKCILDYYNTYIYITESELI